LSALLIGESGAYDSVAVHLAEQAGLVLPGHVKVK